MTWKLEDDMKGREETHKYPGDCGARGMEAARGGRS